MTSTPRLVNLTAAFLSALALTACSGTLTGPSVAPAAPAASLAIETNAVWHLQSMTNANGALQIGYFGGIVIRNMLLSARYIRISASVSGPRAQQILESRD